MAGSAGLEISPPWTPGPHQYALSAERHTLPASVRLAGVLTEVEGPRHVMADDFTRHLRSGRRRPLMCPSADIRRPSEN